LELSVAVTSDSVHTLPLPSVEHAQDLPLLILVFKR
jgi:hypothetical protein